jgi:hypothetical protein
MFAAMAGSGGIVAAPRRKVATVDDDDHPGVRAGEAVILKTPITITPEVAAII